MKKNTRATGPVLYRIAFFQNRRDEEPNKKLARELARTNNKAGIRALAVNLWNENKNIQFDCVKVLYEVGYLAPRLIVPYCGDFLKLIRNRHNRLVWGAMLALSTIANLSAKKIFGRLDDIYSAIDHGSVITVDNGMKILAAIASTDERHSAVIFPRLCQYLRTCRLKSVPQYAESLFKAVNKKNKKQYRDALGKRADSLKGAQLKRIKKIFALLDKE